MFKRLSSLILAILLLGAPLAFTDTYSLQVSSWRTKRQAGKITDKLRAKKLNANFREKKMPTGIWYGVFIDGYKTREEAEKEGKRLLKQKAISEYIVRGQDNSFAPEPEAAIAPPPPAPVQAAPVQAAPPPPPPPAPVAAEQPKPVPAPVETRPPQPAPPKKPAPKKQAAKQPAKKAKKQADKNGLYLDLAASYYHIPEDNSYAEPIYYGSVIGGRLGLGYRLRLGSGHLSLGAESGYMGVKDSNNDADVTAHTVPILLKAGYGLNVTDDVLLRLDVKGGVLLGYVPRYGRDLDPLIGAMLYGEYRVNSTVGVYLGLGGDYLMEEGGDILLPAMEAGVRINF